MKSFLLTGLFLGALVLWVLSPFLVFWGLNILTPLHIDYTLLNWAGAWALAWGLKIMLRTDIKMGVKNV